METFGPRLGSSCGFLLDTVTDGQWVLPVALCYCDLSSPPGLQAESAGWALSTDQHMGSSAVRFSSIFLSSRREADTQ